MIACMVQGLNHRLVNTSPSIIKCLYQYEQGYGLITSAVTLSGHFFSVVKEKLE